MFPNYNRFTYQRFLFLFLLGLDAAFLGVSAAIVHQSFDSVCQVSFDPEPCVSAQIALTFDDGPHALYTKMLLDGLKERRVKATFFLMGESIKGNEELVERMQEEGHLIGNHSYRHIQLTKAGEEAVCDAVEQTEEMIAEITGFRPEYLRPPYGDWNESLECQLNLIPVFWSLDSLDWKIQDTKKIVKKVTETVQDGDIILMHDIFPTSVEAALQIIDMLQGQGYSFVTVDELLID